MRNGCLRKIGWIGCTLGVISALVACGGGLPDVSDNLAGPDSAAQQTRPAATPLVILTGPAAETRPAGVALPDEEALGLMNIMIEEGPPLSLTAIDRILEFHDRRFIAVFIELMRAAEAGLISPSGYIPFVKALETLSDQELGPDWPAWVEWYGGTDLEPPPGFTSWKGALLSKIDPGFGEFLQETVPARIRVEEIQWGGVVIDGIPALNNPQMIPAAQADYLEPGEPVFGIALHGDARAYPLRIMDWHEMANDMVGGIPVSLAYCTLCGAGIAYDGRASDGNTYTFGSSGLLYRSNKLMYDRQTNSLWNQLSGEPVLGELAATNMKLSLLPLVLTSWDAWQRQHPDTLVLDKSTGFSRPYAPGAAYADYFSSSETMFPVWQRSKLLPDKARIYALHLNGVPKAYPLDSLVVEQVLNDELAGVPLALVAQRGSIIVDGQSLRSLLSGDGQQAGKVTYESGGEVRAYRRGEETFHPGQQVDTVVDSRGRVWQVTEEALIGPEGELAPRLPGHLAYWFGWFAFFPHTLLYQGP